MIRALVGSALPILGLGLGVAFIGPDLLAGPRGEPLLVAGAANHMIEPASFDGKACAEALWLAGPLAGDPSERTVGRILALRLGIADTPIAIREIRIADEAGSSTVVLIFEDNGRLLAAGEASAAQLDPAQVAMMEECAVAKATEVGLI